MTNDKYPTIKLKYSLYKTGAWIAVLILVLIALGFDASGHPVETGPHSITPTGASIAFVFVAGCLIFAYYQLLQKMKRNPALVISKEGVVFPRFASQLIPWTLVRDIGLRSVGKRNAQVVELLLRDDIPAELRSKVARKQWLNFRKDRIVVTVVPWGFSGMSEARIVEAFQSYYREFAS